MMIGNLFLVIDPITAIAAGSAIAGLIGTVWSSHMNRKSQRDTNAMQLRAQQATNAFNAAEAQKERDWNDYSSQSDRMRAAGLNPSLMFGGEGSPIKSGSVASGAAVPGLSAPTYDFGQSQIGSLSEIAASINSLAQAGKAGADTKEILTLLKDRAREQAANADKSEFERNMARIDSEFYDQYGHELKRTELQLLKNQSNKTYEEMMLAIEQQDVAKAEAALKSVQKEHTESLKGLTDEQRFALEQRNERIEEYITWEIEQMKSSAASNYGSANLSNTQAKWTPFNSITARMSATTQKYLAENPQTFDAALIRLLKGFTGKETLEDIGKDLRDTLHDQSQDPTETDQIVNDLLQYGQHLFENYTVAGQLTKFGRRLHKGVKGSIRSSLSKYRGKRKR